MLLTAIFAFCSLAQITNSRFTTYSGSIATLLLFFAPIIWYILLPSGGTYTSLEAVEDFFFFEESQFATNFDLAFNRVICHPMPIFDYNDGYGLSTQISQK